MQIFNEMENNGILLNEEASNILLSVVESVGQLKVASTIFKEIMFLLLKEYDHSSMDLTRVYTKESIVDEVYSM